MCKAIGRILRAAQASLTETDSPRLDAELLMAWMLGCSREYLLAYPEMELNREQTADFECLIGRRQLGEPIAYITGRREFWNLELQVDSSVLIPRPETELLVESALAHFSDNNRLQVADLGTGSGAIAIALASHRPGWRIVATDVCPEALALAQRNTKRQELTNIEFRQAAWCEGLDLACYDLILANPPYVGASDPHLQQGDLRFEPKLALMAQQQGYGALFMIASQARRCLKPGGLLMLEHGFEQQHKLKNKVLALGYVEVRGYRDLASLPRMLQAIWPGTKPVRN
ncbi:MAG: peptide chain release factor N(5)-glutamine methyltransferase [Gammaproteobacteria bacterium]|nr:peptide chain release factor N(5)-glutamine methyltransferase [Gammaproteobacteria bacterium]